MIKHLPNTITILRTLASVVVPLMLFKGDDTSRMAALIIYALAAGSDWLDGVLARQLNAISTFGRMLDPIADKLLLAGCLIALATTDQWGWGIYLPALAILLREVFVSGLREFVAGYNLVLHVTYIAKFKTTFQLIALGFAIAVPVVPASWYVAEATLVLFWIAAFLTVASGWDYFRKAMQHDFTS